jgi:hypothetical protein
MRHESFFLKRKTNFIHLHFYGDLHKSVMKWPKQDAFIPFRQRVIVLEQQQDKEEQINLGKLWKATYGKNLMQQVLSADFSDTWF